MKQLYGEISVIKLNGFANIVPTGGGGGLVINQEKTFVVNGIYFPDEGYTGFSRVTVDVTEGSVPPTGTEVLF